MVRILTAHRVFPAKVTGGNGIAGTSVVPSYYLNNTPRVVAAAMTFLGYRKFRDLGGFHHGVVVGPRLFEAMRQQFDRGCAFGIPQEEAGCCRTESTNHPKNVSHDCLLSPFQVLRQ